MNFYPFDPIAGHGLPPAPRRNPSIVPVRFADIIDPKHYGWWRWRFFEVHFQFLKANELRGASYDYFMICCGPFSLLQHLREPSKVIAAIP